MKPLILLFATTALVSAGAQQPTATDIAAWKREAQNVTITRDDWGIAHVHGKTDADAVFGAMYAQAEDDFNRVETNYINSIGRLAEAEGEKEIWRDLRMKLFIDPDSMKAKYAASPAWLKKLMNAYADGLNYYLYTHPTVVPRVIKRFEPWMALTFSEGSIGGDIERVNLNQLAAFYGNPATDKVTGGSPADDDGVYQEPTGSNGIAIAPSNTANHHALLLINPHTSFFFRSELQMTSDEGLNAYGASTWGQFFIYQGFNDRTGWMHTSSGVDAIDEFLETVTKKGDRYYYQHGNDARPVVPSKITVPYKSGGGVKTREFTVYRTPHGPIVRAMGDKWVSIALMQDPVKALTQSYTRTKARSYKAFRQTMELHTNSSNNTIFADADGDIAYFHGNYIPRRDPNVDWTKPVDGSNPATDYHGLLSVDQSPHLLNPASGWIYNSNNWPWSAAGPSSPKPEDYPKYVETGREESPRGYHAIRVLENKKDFTVASLIAAAYDSYLPAFARMIPALLKAYDALPASDSLKSRLAEQIALLRAWDFRWSESSVPTSLAVFWGEDVGRRVGADARRAGTSAETYVANGAAGADLVQSLASASAKLTADFGTWKTPWGDINRFQRLTGDIEQPFNDAGPSIPVPFTSSRWGSLASFGARAYPGTKKWYGTSGNSFVAVVEFGDSVRARAVTAGGESGHPASRHFNDEAKRYAVGDLREVYFYPSQLKGHTEKVYHPGE
ncbi:MAG TPA: penicillin acylase family protein [Gemmatimonadaceae bacterium]|jgi:acyl-homoserine-lactone acylase|nr:penicillin acylase family protein [Gemmatimonadaceae bacterium]